MGIQVTHKYDDIIDLPHHVSAERPHMSRLNRAAQFAPFAALTGYDAAIREAARLTEERIELDESQKAAISDKLRRIREDPTQRQAAITYFVYDEYKAGGAYVTAAGTVKKVDPVFHTVTMADGTVIDMEDIVGVEDMGR